MLKSAAFAVEPVANLQLALGIELCVLPPYLYALWSIKPASEGASVAAGEAANILRSVIYEEMLHASLAANVISSLGAAPHFMAHLMRYPGPLPGHVATGPYAFDVSLAPLSPQTIATFLRIEAPEWAPPEAGAAAEGWITLGAFYTGVMQQLRGLPPESFGKGPQMAAQHNPGPGRLLAVSDLASALAAIETIIDQGEAHAPPKIVGDDQSFELDADHEVAHYYQFQAIRSYFDASQIDAASDLYPVIADPDARRYTPAQQAANRHFNRLYTELLATLASTYATPAPAAFGTPTRLMRGLTHAAAVLRQAGRVPGTPWLAGPTFELVAANGAR